METLVVLLRLGQYVGAVLLFGVPLFFALRMPVSDATIERWPRTPLAVAGLLTALAAIAGLVAQTAVMAGSLTEAMKPAALAYVIQGTGLGAAFVTRAVAAGLAGALVLVLRPGRAAWALLAALGAVVAASLAWTGHGAATEGVGGRLHLAADALHALAAGLWLGALAALALMLRRRHGQAAAAALTHDALHGFAGLGTLAVLLLTATGLVNVWFLVGPERLPSLLASAYGGLLVIKLGLFAAMVVLAACNRFALTPGLGRALDREDARPQALARLRRSLAAESGLAAALLLVVAVMGVLAPPTAMM